MVDVESLKQECSRLQEQYHDLLFKTYVLSHPPVTMEEFRRLMLQSLPSSSPQVSVNSNSSYLEKELLQAKNTVSRLETEKEKLYTQIRGEIEKNFGSSKHVEELKSQLQEQKMKFERESSEKSQREQLNLQKFKDQEELIEQSVDRIEELQTQLSQLQTQLSKSSTNDQNAQGTIHQLVAQKEYALQELKQENEKINKELEESKQLIEIYEEKYSESQIQIKNLQMAIESGNPLETSNSINTSQLKELLAENQRLENEIEILKLQKEKELNEKIFFQNRVQEIKNSTHSALKKSYDSSSQNPQDLSTFLHSIDHSQSRDELQEAKKQLMELKVSIASHENKERDYQLNIHELKEKLSNRIKDLEAKDEKLDELNQKIRDFEESIKYLNEETQRLKSVEQENERIKSELSRIQTQNSSEKSQSESKIQGLIQQLDSLENRLKQFDEIRQELSNTKEENVALLHEMKNFKKKSESDEQSIEQLNKQLKGKNETITNLNKNIQKMNQDIEQVTAKSQNQITEMQNMEAENNSLKKKIKESSEKMESFEEISSKEMNLQQGTKNYRNN